MTRKWIFQKITPFTLLVVALLFLGVSFFFLWLTPGYKLLLVNSSWDRFGNGGGCNGSPDLFSLYDRNGSRQDFGATSSTYFGDAPLYQPDIAYPALADSCLYPPSLPVDIVNSWPKVYPLLIQIQPSDMLSGESKRLEVKTWVDTKFSGLGYEEAFPIVIQPGEQIPVSFSLDAPNFVYSPHNETSSTGYIQIGSTITQRWSIAPLDIAAGEQYIHVGIIGLKSAYTGGEPFANIDINVQPRDDLPLTLRTFLIGLGIPPANLATISILIAIISGLFAMGKSGLEVYKTWLEVHQTRNGGVSKQMPKSRKSKPRR
jgi:hypothetical protein